MLQSLLLSNVGPAPELKFDFAPRLNLITGDNGLGKSLVLDAAWWILTGTWPGRKLLPDPGREAEPTIVVKTDESEDTWAASLRIHGFAQHGQPPYHSPILYAGADGGFSVWDPMRASWEEDSRRGRTWITTGDFHFTASEVWDGLVNNEKPLCNGLIRDWTGWQKGDDASFTILKKVLGILSPPGETLRPGLPTRVSLDDSRDHPTLRLPYGVVPVSLTSAGMKRILALSYLLVWTWQEHLVAAKLNRKPPSQQILFLIDEMDAHLHPLWQRKVLPSLLHVMAALTGDKDFKVQVIANTHSPLVLASLEPVYDNDLDAVFTFDLVRGKGGKKVKVKRVIWRRMGEVDNWLTSDLFDLKIARSQEAETALLDAQKALDDPDLTQEQLREVYRRLRDTIGETDPFWMRWRSVAKKWGMEP